MQCATECAACAMNNLNKVLCSFVPDQQDRIRETRAMLRFLADFDYTQPPPEILRWLSDNLPRITGLNDCFFERRSQDNANLLTKYDDFKAMVNAHPDPFRAAVLFAITGNIIDYTPSHGLDMDAIVQGALNTKLTVDHTARLYKDLPEAKRILYLLDNAGEVVADKLFIEFLLERGIVTADKLTVVVRGRPTFNDALYSDAEQVGLTGLAEVIDNGDNAPGITMSRCSGRFREYYERADLIISKGMGNYESLHDVRDKKIYFLLTSKCNNVTQTLGLPLHSFVCQATHL
jgi:uncharacterized protein with ATP-grasp and redox domains